MSLQFKPGKKNSFVGTRIKLASIPFKNKKPNATMARISFTAIVSEIVGKLAGTVFQYSYGGFQIHTRVSPNNPQTNYQQLRRGWYGFIRANWRNLSNTERASFNDNAPTPGEGFNFFTGNNINLILVSEPMISFYTPAATPDQFEFEITEAAPTTLTIKATGMITTVPTGMRLLLYSTAEKPPSRLFTNPSDYSPIIAIDEGTDLSTPYEVITDYNSRFGQITGEKYLAIKTVLIRKSTGDRGPEYLTNTNTETMAQKYIPLQTLLAAMTNTTTALENLVPFTIPANTLLSNGDRIVLRSPVRLDNSGAGNSVGYIAGNTSGNLFFSASNFDIIFQLEIIRVNSTTLKFIASTISNFIQTAITSGQSTTEDFTQNILIAMSVTASTVGDIVAKYATIDLIKAP